MGTTTGADEAIEALQNDLETGLATGYPEKREYVPRSCLQKHVTRATIRQCLPDARDDLIEFIYRKASRIFAILLYSCCLPGRISLGFALQTCKDRSLTDAELPFPRRNESCSCSEQRTNCRHPVARDVLGKWTFHCWERFCNTQWMFLGLEFQSDVFEYNLDERRILPIKLLDGHNEGFFGEVREGLLNEDHAKDSERVSVSVWEADKR